MRVLPAIAAVAVLAAACARPAPHALPPGRPPLARLGDADALLASGCLDCLLDAYLDYATLASEPTVRSAALAGSVRAALLVALREHELGLPDDEYMTLARGNIADTASDLVQLVAIIDTLTSLPPAQRPVTSDAEVAAARVLSRDQAAWAAFLRPRASGDVTFAYVWLSLACTGRAQTRPSPEERAAVLGGNASIALVRYKELTTCLTVEGEAIRAHMAGEPRTRELHYYLGLAALSGQGRPDSPRGFMDVDEAGRAFAAAYEWRRDWPALALARGNVALAAEDYDAAWGAFEEALTLRPNDPEALLGSIRALTYLARHGEALARTDVLLALNWSPGDARYWRALNEHGLRQYEAAWADVELAARLLINADVPKLGGLVALALGRVADARTRFEQARSRRPGDCEAGYYLQAVLATERDWEATARVAAEAAGCMDAEERRLTTEIEGLRLAPTIDAARRARQVASRENQLRATRRMRAASWFNAAVGNFNLTRAEPARAFAMRLVDDADFAARARDSVESSGRALKAGFHEGDVILVGCPSRTP